MRPYAATAYTLFDSLYSFWNSSNNSEKYTIKGLMYINQCIRNKYQLWLTKKHQMLISIFKRLVFILHVNTKISLRKCYSKGTMLKISTIHITGRLWISDFNSVLLFCLLLFPILVYIGKWWNFWWRQSSTSHL